jgi:hypothetical protein
MIFYLVSFRGRCSGGACDLFRCHHVVFHNGIRIVSVSSFRWWISIHDGVIVSLQVAFLSSRLEYDIGVSFFIVDYWQFLFFLRPHEGLLVFYIDPIHIILSKIQLKISQRWNYTLVYSLHKKTRLMSYKYIMNPLNSRFKIFSFLTFSVYIFLESIFLKYHCTFSLYKVIDLNI